MRRLGRILAAALLVLMVLLPGAALAAESGNPLAELPPEYEPAVDAAAKEFGVDAEELKSASRSELEDLLCGELQALSAEEIAKKAKAAIDDLPAADREKLTPARIAQLESQLPALMVALEADLCADDDAGSDSPDDDSSTDDAAAPQSAGDSGDSGSGTIPTPNRIDTGAGGSVTPTGIIAAVLAGALALLGTVAAAGRRRTR